MTDYELMPAEMLTTIHVDPRSNQSYIRSPAPKDGAGAEARRFCSELIKRKEEEGELSSYYHRCLAQDARLLRRGDILVAEEVMRNEHPWTPGRKSNYHTLVWC